MIGRSRAPPPDMERDPVAPTREQVAAIEEWIRATFKEARVGSGYNFDREVTLFRARHQKAPTWAKELEIADEVFEDHSIDKIVQALQRQRAEEQLRADPERRLLLRRDLVLGLSGYDPRHGEAR